MQVSTCTQKDLNYSNINLNVKEAYFDENLFKII